MQVGKDLLLDIDLVTRRDHLRGRGDGVGAAAEFGIRQRRPRDDEPADRGSAVERARLQRTGAADSGRRAPAGTGNVTRIRPEFVNGTTISGVRGRQVSYYLDGADTSEQHQGGSWIQTSVDALQEFSVQQNAYSAEHSRSGSFYNATTKSGTNDVHGTVYEFLRNEKLDSRNFFGTKRDILKRNQFGASVGGPVVHPEGLRRPEPHVLLRQLRRHAGAPGQHHQPHQPHGRHARRGISARSRISSTIR